jgi:lysozyme
MSFSYGLDVSNWQKLVDWNIVAQQGVAFVFIKASQADGKDPSFKNHWPGARAAGLLRGAYHFFVEATPPQSQADNFLQVLGDDPGELPPVVDVERLRKVVNGQIVTVPIQNPARFADNLLTYLQLVETKLGRRPIIYTGQSVWNEVMRINGAFPAWAATYDLWVANYMKLGFSKSTRLTPDKISGVVELFAQGQMKPALPKSWTQWRFWQFTGDTYLLDGVRTKQADGTQIQSFVDLNVFFGTADELRAWARVDGPHYADISRYTNQKVLAAFVMAFGASSGQVLATTGLLTKLNTSPTSLYTGPAIQDIPGLSFEQELALNSALLRQFSHQKVINAFAACFGTGFWDIVIRAGLAFLADDRGAIYTGPGVDDLPLTPSEKAALKDHWPML